MSKISDLAKELTEADALVKELSDKLDDAKSKREEISNKLSNEMQEQDLFEVSVDGINKKFILRKETYATYLVENKEKVFNRLRQVGMGDIIKEDVNNKTFNSTIRTLLELGNGTLPECLNPYVTLFEKSKIGIVKKG